VKVTGNKLVDYAVIPGIVFGVLAATADLLGKSGQNILGEGSATTGFGGIFVFLLSAVTAVALAYLFSKQESRVWSVVLLGAIFGISKSFASTIVVIAIEGINEIGVSGMDYAKSLVLNMFLYAIFYAIAAVGGLALRVLENLTLVTKKLGK
jgi:hypothetical protein